jgi:hypothetical protein
VRESLVYVRVCVFMEERDHLVREMSVFSSFLFFELCARARSERKHSFETQSDYRFGQVIGLWIK